MQHTFMFIVLIAIIGVIFFVLRREWKKSGIALLVGIISFIGFGVTSESNEDLSDTNEVAAEEVPVEKAEELSNESSKETDPFEYYANEHFEILEYVKHDASNRVDLSVKMAGGWDEEHMIDTFNYSTVDFLSDIQDEEYGEIYIEAFTELVDDYGQTKDVKVIIYNLPKEEVDKVNFENFRIENLLKLSRSPFIHPVFQ